MPEHLHVRFPVAPSLQDGNEIAATAAPEDLPQITFPLCPDKGVDFIPCLDNEKAIKALKGRKHYEHRERHCPAKGDPAFLDCLLPLPKGYKYHVPWPESRDSVSGACTLRCESKNLHPVLQLPRWWYRLTF